MIKRMIKTTKKTTTRKINSKEVFFISYEIVEILSYKKVGEKDISDKVCELLSDNNIEVLESIYDGTTSEEDGIYTYTFKCKDK